MKLITNGNDVAIYDFSEQEFRKCLINGFNKKITDYFSKYRFTIQELYLTNDKWYKLNKKYKKQIRIIIFKNMELIK